MMLSAGDLFTIVATTIGCSAVVAGLALLVSRLRGRFSIGTHLAAVVLTAIASLVLSVVAISAEMYLSEHDLSVLFWVLGFSTVISLAAAWLVGRSLRSSLVSLRTSARQLGEGEVLEPERAGVREITELSTQLAETSEKLARARAEIEQLDASRREFIAWISHDLRTPLAGVRLLAEAMEEGVAEDPLDQARQIRVQVDTLSRMVDDLFELSRIQNGSLQLQREAVDLLDIVSDAVADVRPLAATRRIRIVQAGVGGQMLWADPHELSRVVLNLLTNGIRHAPEHSEILISATADDNDALVLSVLDHGSGVESEDLGRMFDVGWRASAARTPAIDPIVGGAGLGLAIVRGIVEAHGGRVGAEHVGDGFRLNVTLPRSVPSGVGGAVGS